MSVVQTLVKRDRAIAAGALVFIVALAWAYTVNHATGLHGEHVPGMWMAPVDTWSPIDFVSLMAMWVIMMIAMMLPSIAPLVLGFVTINHRRNPSGRARTSAIALIAGYASVWTAFSVLATLGQWELHRRGILTPMMRSSSFLFSAGLLLAAGAYQWSPLKDKCLTQCKSPTAFLLTEWRPGIMGAWQMGVRHGVYCVGCCWLVMLLMFVGGMMNLLWFALLTGFVVSEKLIRGKWFSRTSGVVALGAGFWMLGAGIS